MINLKMNLLVEVNSLKIIDVLKCICSSVIAKTLYRNKNYWVVAERGTDARDNGYWFYKYLREKHPEINAVYVIKKNSPDYKKVAVLGKIVSPDSIFHGIIYYSAAKIIGTHPGCGQPNWKTMHCLERFKIAVPKGHRVFLQHGITKDMIPCLTAKILQTDLFICGAKPEYDYINENYGFKENIVKYTGFARFDNLEVKKEHNKDNDRKTILLMPTWRHSLSGKNENEFIQSEYYLRYNQILNSDEIDRLLKKYKCNLIFYPHYEMQKWIKQFKKKSPNIIIADFINFDVQNLLKKADILITDYSSVFFDVAYMKKETIFYQFDYKEYRSTHYSKGYFDYNNSFGPVVSTFDDLIQEIENYLMYGIEQRYITNMNKYYIYNDKNNCNRIYNAINEIR